MVNDLIADLITRIRNGHTAHLSSILVYNSKFSRRFLDLLYDQGFICGYSINHLKQSQHYLNVYLKYSGGQPTIKKIYKISTKGRRVYCGVAELWRLNHGFGHFIISTTKGLMIDEKARYLRLGGEVIAYVE
jgi:small subunit ribosomal protein S8